MTSFMILCVIFGFDDLNKIMIKHVTTFTPLMPLFVTTKIVTK